MKNKWILILCIALIGCVNTKLDAIRGKETSEIRQLKGEPVTVVTENGRKMWTYRQGMCTELVFFDPEEKVDGFHEFGECMPIE